AGTGPHSEGGQVTEHVVVAGRGPVSPHDDVMDKHRPRAVGAAADALPGDTTGAGRPAAGLVGGDGGGADFCGRGDGPGPAPVEEAAAEAVAPVAASASASGPALRLVAGDNAVAQREGRGGPGEAVDPAVKDAAAVSVAAAAAAGPVAARRLV